MYLTFELYFIQYMILKYNIFRWLYFVVLYFTSSYLGMLIEFFSLLGYGP